MTTIIASIILAGSTNIDNLAVGVAYGLKQNPIGLIPNSVIAIGSGVSTFCAMQLGVWLNQFFAPSLAHSIGSLVLILFGGWSVAKIMIQKFNSTSAAILNQHQPMSITQAMLIGLALTATNFGTGIGAAIAGLNVYFTSVCSFISSLIMIGGGAALGNTIAVKLSQNRLSLASGFLLIGLGIYEFSTSG